MAKSKRKQTPLQREWEKEYKKLKRRAKSWEKTHRILYSDYPTMPKRVTKESIEKIKRIRYKSLTKSDIERYKVNYEEAYENRELPIQEESREPYEPPTESDYYEGEEDLSEDSWDNTPNKPADSYDEIDLWLENIIESILDTSQISKPNLEIRDILSNLINSARSQMGDKEFYEFLSEGDRVDRLQQAAYEGMSTSPTPNSTNRQYASDAVIKFATELNAGRPLTDENAYSIQTFGTMDFDFSDMVD